MFPSQGLDASAALENIDLDKLGKSPSNNKKGGRIYDSSDDFDSNSPSKHKAMEALKQQYEDEKQDIAREKEETERKAAQLALQVGVCFVCFMGY